MKKLKKVAAISIVTMCFLNNIVLAETKEINTATRVRKEASTDSKIVTVLYPGNDVEVLSKDGEWSKIKRGEYTGYVKTEFLKELEDKDDESEINNTTKNEVKNEIKNEVKNELKQEDKLENKVSENISNKNITNSDASNIVEEVVQTLPENKVAILIKTELNILPNFFSKNILDLDAGTELEIIDTMNNWYKIRTSEGREGWILKSKTTNKVLNVEKQPENIAESGNNVDNNTQEKPKEEPKNENNVEKDNNTNNNSTKKGVVDVETANVRSEASTSSIRVAFLDYGEIVTIVSEENGFYKIEKNDIKGYVSKDLISVDQDKISSRSLAEERKEEVLRKESLRNEEKNLENVGSIDQNNIDNTENTDKVVDENSTKGVEIANYAKQFLGINYVLGGKTPESGFDCAGFTKYVYKNFGVTLGSIASAQNSIGTDVAREDLKVGDLLLFQNEEKTKIGHTGVYLGNGEFIHAANPQRGVVIDNLNTMSYYNTRFVNAKRIVE